MSDITLNVLIALNGGVVYNMFISDSEAEIEAMFQEWTKDVEPRFASYEAYRRLYNFRHGGYDGLSEEELNLLAQYSEVIQGINTRDDEILWESAQYKITADIPAGTQTPNLR